MPKRVVKPYKFEKETERTPLTPALERKLMKVAVDRAHKELAEWHTASQEKERFYAAPHAAMGAYTLGDRTLAREIAVEALRLAPAFPDNWNYGNALHFAHTALGLLELERGNTQAAAEHLRLSAEMPGSPQLNSFGPSMRLARDLLRLGFADQVLGYLRECRRFWRMGETWLNIWEKKVQRGAMPTFFMQLYR